MGLNIEKRSLLYMVSWFDGLYGLCFFLSLPEYFDCKTNPVFSIVCLQAHLEAFQKRIEKVLSR